MNLTATTLQKSSVGYLISGLQARRRGDLFHMSVRGARIVIFGGTYCAVAVAPRGATRRWGRRRSRSRRWWWSFTSRGRRRSGTLLRLLLLLSGHVVLVVRHIILVSTVGSVRVGAIVLGVLGTVVGARCSSSTGRGRGCLA
jgi:hypothetical protein